MPDSPGGTRHHADDGTLRIQKPALLQKGFFMGKYHELYIGYFYCLSILVTRYRTVQYLNLYVMCWIHKIASRRPFYLLTLASLLIAIWFIQQPFFRVISIIRGIRSWGHFLYWYAAAPVRCCCSWCEIHKGVSRCESRMLCGYIHIHVEIPSKMSVSRFMGYLKGKRSLMLYEHLEI